MLRKKLAVLLAMVMMLGVMSVSPAMAIPAGGFNPNNGNKVADGGDKNQGGGQEKINNAHPPHAGDGSDSGGGND